MPLPARWTRLEQPKATEKGEEKGCGKGTRREPQGFLMKLAEPWLCPAKEVDAIAAGVKEFANTFKDSALKVVQEPRAL
eukprot:617885-Amphidinium_carterae.1